MSDGSPPAPERLVDLYALLGLEPLEADRTRIEQSLKRLANQIQARAQSAAADSPQRAQVARAQKLFGLGKQHLLDPAAKARYDQQWRGVYGSVARTGRAEKPLADKPLEQSPQAAAADRPAADRPSGDRTPTSGATGSRTSMHAWDLSELQALLPEGDPSAPFRPEEYLASRPAELAAGYAEDFDKLLSLLAPQSAPEPLDAAAASAASNDSPSTFPPAELPAAEPLPVSPPSGDRSAAAPPQLSRESTSPLAQRLRRKHGPPLLWQALGVLAAVVVVLGIAYWRLQPARNPLLADKPAEGTPPALLAAADDGLDATRPPAAAATYNPAESARELPPRRSGLPSVPGIEAILPAGEASSAGGSGVPPADSAPAESAPAESTPAESVPAESAPAESAPAESAPAESAPAESAPAESLMHDSTLMDLSASGAAASSETDSPGGGDEGQQWAEGMLAARRAIGQQQFTQASAQLDSLRALARTPLQTQQLTRLATLAQLAERFRQALDKALAGMGAAESFSFGNSNLASFVEADGERVILRIEGRNQTFAMSELPLEIALAIVDLGMDREHPQSLAAKAAFMLLHPASRSDGRALKQAQQMMSVAVAANAVPPDMQRVFQDDFRLP